MSNNVAFVLTVICLAAAGVALVMTEHYGWAWIPWLAMFGVRFKSCSCGGDNQP